MRRGPGRACPARRGSAPPARRTPPAKSRRAGRRESVAGLRPPRRGWPRAGRRRFGPAGSWRGRAAAVSGSTSACRPTPRSASVRPYGCRRARSRAARGPGSRRPAGQADSGSTRRRRRRTTPVAVATGWWPANTERTPAARRPRRSRAAIRPAACCRCAATPTPGMTTACLSPAESNQNLKSQSVKHD